MNDVGLQRGESVILSQILHSASTINVCNDHTGALWDRVFDSTFQR